MAVSSFDKQYSILAVTKMCMCINPNNLVTNWPYFIELCRMSMPVEVNLSP
jgi:hypothetical protein